MSFSVLGKQMQQLSANPSHLIVNLIVPYFSSFLTTKIKSFSLICVIYISGVRVVKTISNGLSISHHLKCFMHRIFIFVTTKNNFINAMNFAVLEIRDITSHEQLGIRSIVYTTTNNCDFLNLGFNLQIKLLQSVVQVIRAPVIYTMNNKEIYHSYNL